ncbi:MAG: SUMF1/EgtB/PvdO family nonheme iron enzyme [Anaerolineae bacterium]|nr:SUMF1/EgtB/PvdO family nonheme iron enzyme [Anaerolineae bacterium]
MLDNKNTKIGGAEFKNIKDSNVNIGSVNTSVTAKGDVVGGDKITHYYFHSEVVQASPPLSYEPETIVIPEGSFIMGSDYGEPNEAPQHCVELLQYRIGKYPVTNWQYVEFTRQTGRVVDSALLWDGNRPAQDKLNHPVTGVTWYEAVAYCEWLSEQTGRRYILPSEAQWEKAARTIDGRLYPWGNDWQKDRCNTSEEFTAVDAFPVQNDYGCFDMVGNAREWTTTLWGESPQMPDPKFSSKWQNDGRDNLNAPKTTRRIYRGGRLENFIDYRCSLRGAYLPDKSGPKRDRHSFRVVLLPI